MAWLAKAAAFSPPAPQISKPAQHGWMFLARQTKNFAVGRALLNGGRLLCMMPVTCCIHIADQK